MPEGPLLSQAEDNDSWSISSLIKSQVRHISNFDANTGLLNIRGEPAFIDSLLHLTLDFGAHSLGSLFPHALEMEELQQHFQNKFCSTVFSLEYYWS